MGKWSVERWAASTGIGFALVLVVANFVAGTRPKYYASAAKDLSWLHDKHRAIVVGGILSGIAIVLFLWFLASFAGTFREAGQRRLSTIIYGAGVATVALAAAGEAVYVSLSRLSYFVDPKTIQGLYATDSFIFIQVWWPVLALSLATVLAARRSKVLPDWYAWLTLAGSVVFLLGALSVKTIGFFSVTGGMSFIAFLVFAVWIAVSSAVLVQKLAT
jgi:hypothetical protein